MELRHLKYFIIVAEKLHFGKAAAQLKMAQPPLSQQIKKLESELDVLLFFRTKRQVELTEAGEVFLERAYQILNNVEAASEEARRVHRGEVGDLILGFTGTAAFDGLSHILEIFREKFPNVNVILRQLPSAEQVKALHEGEIHLGLLVPPVESKWLNLEMFREVPFIVALPKTHHLVKQGAPIEVSDLVNESFIMTPRNIGSSYYDSIISLCYHAGFSPKICQEAHELQTIVALVSSGVGVALVPKPMQFFKTDGIVYFELKKSFTTVKTALAWHKDNNSPIVQPFLEVIKQSINPH
ncbi:DNA-binding transcriptional regulator, LysR family [Halobacillus dabanensis]|uniref:DNA-binding transcriptional regulator, LysR family n=1 Tax=Halobacillus dabanensis TaxID=240302 RepID=A0A1I3YHR4_HALDA|nr:LysR family transcriptional regulator [Halobacillus dabanensis]SFK31408.1 DNA-binding transcriptional regulator, LysR family [Halobacillus dabanensis]